MDTTSCPYDPGVIDPGVIDGELVKRLLTDPRVSREPHRHWPARAGGELGDTWSLAMWVSDRSMITTYGTEHSRLRRAGSSRCGTTADPGSPSGS
ncbi:hypothetical protein [Streptomyces sp. NPDC059593]|uniref:hypothetical protein n=1 Tax=Streptomyces sp. NPDC059593 TaxID=3346878 RepID=UPI0036A1A5B2